MASGTQIQAENARLRGQLSTAIANANYWRERAIFLEAERDHYRDQVRGDVKMQSSISIDDLTTKTTTSSGGSNCRVIPIKRRPKASAIS